jgi:hypothetical protein
MNISADIRYDGFGIKQQSIVLTATGVTVNTPVEAKEKVKHGSGFYHIISHAGMVFERMVGLWLSYKIPRAGVQTGLQGFS